MQEYRVKQVLRGHTDRVNSVSWIPNTSGSCAAHLFIYFILFYFFAPRRGVLITIMAESVEARWKSPETELVSGSSDKTVVVWRKSQSSEEACTHPPYTMFVVAVPVHCWCPC